MKLRQLKQLLYLAPLALAGCVGFNTALFTTKSNAGLDLDMKPPTAEINISRKEGVVEPSFEGGQTPPVLASFSTKIGHNKMESFFFGVNQTFAGGDAAVTMAKLYAQTNDFVVIEADGKEKNKDNLKDLFDSKLTLSEPPKANAKEGFLGWRKKLFGLAKPGEVRPFFFGTDTQFGVKVAWNGVGGPYPDTVKAGFNRKEIAVAPVTINDQNEVRIPSFLATVDSSAKGAITAGTNSLGVKQDVNWLQYFATGQSADYLARQRGVRQAMLERADPKAAAAAVNAGKSVEKVPPATAEGNPKKQEVKKVRESKTTPEGKTKVDDAVKKQGFANWDAFMDDKPAAATADQLDKILAEIKD